MKQNTYDDPAFFAEYAQMPRSVDGLAAAGEWPAFRTLLPDLRGARVLDMGCGYGWHCRYAAEEGAATVVGIDLSAQMIAKARSMTTAENIRFVQTAIEDFDAAPETFDVVLSSLAMHYVRDLAPVFSRIAKLLVPGGVFCYSAEHPVFTARPQQDWHYDANGAKAHWPVDGYFQEGERRTAFLGGDVIKYHRTIASHFHMLQAAGFVVDALDEPAPSHEMMRAMGWQDELRRPMMVIFRAVKR
ncbi:class I SAM-dependent methyltransferase [Desulfovibrio sp. OttesenSCG-928-I05]|nr:class I SAM-dependent methyltransferase [Desulfovibrio sp. OttesenSCG-928-I05]